MTGGPHSEGRHPGFGKNYLWLQWEGVDWIHLSQDKDQWLTLVNTLLNLRVSLKAGNFLSS
jgi:hypothetical protein